MEDRFLQRFFPASKAAKLQSDINHFVQKSNETLYDAWTHFRKMFRKFPQHGLSNFNKVQIFYKGVNVPTRKEIDIAAGGSLMKKTPDEAYNIISKTATHSYDCTETSDELASVKAQLATFKRQMYSMTKEMHAIKVGCELCQGPHLTKDCNQETMEEQQVRSQHASIQNLERDVGRIAQSLTKRPSGALPSNIIKSQVPTYSHVNAISGDEGYDFDEVIPTYTHNGVDGWIRVSDITPAYGNYLMSLMTGSSSNSGSQESKMKSVEITESPEFSVGESEVEEEVKPSPKLKVYKPPIPYPRLFNPSNQRTLFGEHGQASSAFLEAECVAILEKSDIPPKLGASINLMSLSVYSRLGLNELKLTNTGVRLVNQSISKPIGIAENLVVKVCELEFPADFVVVDMSEDKVVPIVLGRPFLATAGALTDWRTCKLILRDRASKPNKCGRMVEEKLVDTPEDRVIDKSMRKLYNRVRNSMSEKDEHVRNRLMSNLSRKKKEKLRELTKESKMADVWLLNVIGYRNLIKGSGGLKDGTAYHPGIS
ncbi:uncharacterized protein [Rutidosis leptorrhynchoides]|uniref:uncharacterized protein n=1 Tax=Rutidosis leptorrhynchoides TaxID=125765 RepID=UPI003A99B1D7